MPDRQNMGAVLVVEDNLELREATTAAIEALGVRAIGVENGVQGLEQLKDLEHQPSMVLLDLMMPEMNGWRFLAEVERDGRIPRLPIFVLSSVADDCPRLPLVTGYIQKPLSLRRLESLVKQHCGAWEPSPDNL